PNVSPGTYELIAGDQSRVVEIGKTQNAGGPSLEVELHDVRRPIDLQSSPIWEVAMAFGVSSDAVWRLSQQVQRVFDATDLAHVLGITENTLREALPQLTLSWPVTPLRTLAQISQQEVLELEGAGIYSVQDLWRKSGSADIAALAKVTNIPIKRLKVL